MPQKRTQHAMASAGGKVYAIGGCPTLPICVPIGGVEVYDPRTKQWKTAGVLNSPRRLLATAVLNDTIYALGGQDSKGETMRIVEKFNGSEWVTLLGQSMPTARYSCGAAAVEVYDPRTKQWKNKLVVAGGVCVGPDGHGCNIQPEPPVPYYQTSVAVYDPSADRRRNSSGWIESPAVAPMNSGRWGHCVVALGGLVYSIGGVDGPFIESGPVNVLKEVEAYDITKTTTTTTGSALGKWSAVANMNIARWAAAAAALNEKLYVMGGQDINRNTLNSVEYYEPGAPTWKPAPAMGTVRYFCAAATLGNVVYVTGGGASSSPYSSNSGESLCDPWPCTPSSTPPAPTPAPTPPPTPAPTPAPTAPPSPPPLVVTTHEITELPGKRVSDSNKTALYRNAVVASPGIGLVVLGGWKWDGKEFQDSNQVLRYHPGAVNSWTNLPNMITARRDFAAVMMPAWKMGGGTTKWDTIYAIGGRHGPVKNPTNMVNVESLIHGKGAWDTKKIPPLPQYAVGGGLYLHSAASLGNYIFVVGGVAVQGSINGGMFTRAPDAWRGTLMLEFGADGPSQDGWLNTGYPLNHARASFALIALPDAGNGILVAAGGEAREGTDNSPSIPLPQIETMDLKTMTWTGRASLKVARSECDGASLNGKAYIMGGFGRPDGWVGPKCWRWIASKCSIPPFQRATTP